MQGHFSTVFLGILALMLAFAAIGDLRSREISNWLNGAIALLAIPFWWSVGLSPWPDMAVQLGVALGVFALFALLFNFGVMGGGDVKMIAALALWLPAGAILNLLIIMSIAGGALTLAMLIRRRVAKSDAQIEVPYGVAIAFGGLWVIAEPFLNQFGS
jgi:prepilin peptidase CpaA